MPRKEMVIVGAGMGGLAAGIYAQANGYRSRIFESHSVPGGQAATWKRKGYSFDGCVHHLFGCRPGTHLYGLWNELGVMPRELAQTRECVAAMAPDGREFIDYYDLDLLESHLKELAPADAAVIDEYLHGIRLAARHDFYGEMILGSKVKMLPMLPAVVALRKWFKPTMADWGRRFSDPFLQRACPLLEYSFPEAPALLHLLKHAHGMRGDIQWPVGGATALAQSMAERYRELGGELNLRTRVSAITTDAGRVTGVRVVDGGGGGRSPHDLAGGTGVAHPGDGGGHGEHVPADVVISDGDGRSTILDLLGGRFVDERVLDLCDAPQEEDSNWAVHVFLGVDRDLSSEPSAIVILLDEPVEIAGHTCHSLELQTYGMDPTMAPAGKCAIKAELFSSWSYWQRLLNESRERYDEEKQRVADQVITILERRWPGLRQDVEVVDVPTLQTWKRYMGGYQGFNDMPNKPFDVMASLGGKVDSRLPGLEGFRFVGSWATSAGALFMNALSGRTVMAELCNRDGVRFRPPA